MALEFWKLESSGQRSGRLESLTAALLLIASSSPLHECFVTGGKTAVGASSIDSPLRSVLATWPSWPAHVPGSVCRASADDPNGSGSNPRSRLDDEEGHEGAAGSGIAGGMRGAAL